MPISNILDALYCLSSTSASNIQIPHYLKNDEFYLKSQAGVVNFAGVTFIKSDLSKSGGNLKSINVMHCTEKDKCESSWVIVAQDNSIEPRRFSVNQITSQCPHIILENYILFRIETGFYNFLFKMLV